MWKEATALYWLGAKPMGVKVTRITHGLPAGGNWYADEMTRPAEADGAG